MTESVSAGAFRGSALTSENDVRFSKVPEVALGFWIIKILATTLGETGGDAVTMSLGLGYAVGTLIFLAWARWQSKSGPAVSTPMSIG